MLNYADYLTVTLNLFCSNKLRLTRYSDYSSVTRKSNPNKGI